MMSGGSGSVSQDIEFNDLVPHLVRELESDAKLIVLPNVVMRSGEYVGGRLVRWDGVKRREKIRMISGTTSVASLYVMIYERDGTRLFSAYGGLDLLFGASLQVKKYELREDRLQDEENLREGVCISFHPFFGEEQQC